MWISDNQDLAAPFRLACVCATLAVERGVQILKVSYKIKTPKHSWGRFGVLMVPQPGFEPGT